MYEGQFQIHEDKLKQLQSELDSKVSRMEGAISGVHAATANAAGSARGSSGGDKTFPLDNDKKLDHIAVINGSEKISELFDWRRRCEIQINGTFPGSIEVFEWLHTIKKPITSEMRDERPQKVESTS